MVSHSLSNGDEWVDYTTTSRDVRIGGQSSTVLCWHWDMVFSGSPGEYPFKSSGVCE